MSSSAHARAARASVAYSARATRSTTLRSQRWAGTSSSLRCHSIAVSRRGEVELPTWPMASIRGYAEMDNGKDSVHAFTQVLWHPGVTGVVQNPPFLGYTRRAETAGL